jgi:hypothetical protein
MVSCPGDLPPSSTRRSTSLVREAPAITSWAPAPLVSTPPPLDDRDLSTLGHPVSADVVLRSDQW